MTACRIPERVAFHGDGSFLKAVRMRVEARLAGAAPKGDRRLLRKAAVILVWFAASYILLLTVHSVWLQAMLCVSYGLAAAAIGFNIFHDANHGAISPRPWVNAAVSMAASALLGPSRYLWNFKHQVLHHRFTNLAGLDDDLETRGFLRISPQQDWKPRYRGQHLFVFALYAINAIEMVFIKDQVQFFTLKMSPHQAIPALSPVQMLEFWGLKAVYLLVFIALPFALLPAWHVVIGFLIYQVTLGLALALVFGMAHQVECVAFPAPAGAPPAIAEEWAAHQMRTTANFATRSRAWSWFSGGLNHQIEHHLFPHVSHTHYAGMTQTVRDTAAEFGLPYHHFETYGAALHSHYRLLRSLGRGATA